MSIVESDVFDFLEYGETTTITELEKKVRDNDCWDALVVPGNFSQVLIGKACLMLS